MPGKIPRKINTTLANSSTPNAINNIGNKASAGTVPTKLTNGNKSPLQPRKTPIARPSKSPTAAPQKIPKEILCKLFTVSFHNTYSPVKVFGYKINSLTVSAILYGDGRSL